MLGMLGPFLSLLLLTLAGFLWSSEDAHACAPAQFLGSWENVRAETNILSRLEVVEDCSAPGGMRIRALEKCTPRDCTWGWTTHARLEERTLTVTFSTFTAIRTLELSGLGSRLRAGVTIDYRNPDRMDERAAYILVPVSD